MSEEKTETRPRIRSAGNSKIPLCSVIDDPEMFREVVQLLKESTTVKVKQSELADCEDEIRDRLAAICEAYELPGVRHGRDCFEYYGWQTRKTMSKERLLALGVSAEIIDAAYVEGKPFLSSKINPFDID